MTLIKEVLRRPRWYWLVCHLGPEGIPSPSPLAVCKQWSSPHVMLPWVETTVALHGRLLRTKSVTVDSGAVLFHLVYGCASADDVILAGTSALTSALRPL